MLVELSIRDLGIIDECRLLLGPGMTAVTGETGAGKTMIVDAIELLVGGRAEAHLVRHGAQEAVVEGRFVLGDDEHVLRRVVPRDGRSRAYLDGELATASALARMGEGLVDLHGQHDHQSLLATAVQRQALDRFGEVPVELLVEATVALSRIEGELGRVGGDEESRRRELELLRFQVDELEAARLEDPHEDERLGQEEDLLSGALEHRLAGAEAMELLGGEGGAGDAVAAALSRLDGRGPFEAAATRLGGALAELTDLVAELRRAVELIEEDPARLQEVRARRQLLADLRRKYGGSLVEVIGQRSELGARMAELEAHATTAERLAGERREALARVEQAEATVHRGRSAAAPALAEAVAAHLRELAMPGARLEVHVGGRAGADVELRLAADPGSPPLPLAKVASGGELARAMLALRLVLTAGPPTLVFDEVDAGIGGQAALAVGRSLASLGARHQVLVVTHLAQVAAHADHHVVVRKSFDGGRAVTRAAPTEGDERVVELSRMLSGSPDSEAAQRHAADLLERVRAG